MREKVAGVGRCCFLPRLVAFFTMPEEFHSVKKTFRFWSSNQRLTRYIRVDLPDLSSPSNAMRLPG